MVLGVELELLHSLESQAALIAAVLVDVSVRDRQLRPFVVDFIEVHLERAGGLEDLVTAFLPAQKTSCIFSSRLVFLQR